MLRAVCWAAPVAMARRACRESSTHASVLLDPCEVTLRGAWSLWGGARAPVARARADKCFALAAWLASSDSLTDLWCSAAVLG